MTSFQPAPSGLTITLFHGSLGLVAAILLVVGAGAILSAIQNWLRDRFTLDLHLLWHVIPRRFRIHLRWDRPLAIVRLGDGREGCLLYLLEHDDAPCPIALVQPYDEDDGPATQCPEWMVLDALTAVPRRTLRETWRYLRSTGEGPS